MRRPLNSLTAALIGLALGACSEVPMTTKTESLLVTNTTPQPVEVGVSTGSSVYGAFVGPGYNLPVAPQDSLCVRPSPIGFAVEVWVVGDTAANGANLNFWSMPSVGSWTVTVWPDSIHAVPGPAC